MWPFGGAGTRHGELHLSAALGLSGREGSSRRWHLGALISRRGWVSLPPPPAPFCPLPPPSPRAGVPGTGSGDKWPELGHRQGKASLQPRDQPRGIWIGRVGCWVVA